MSRKTGQAGATSRLNAKSATGKTRVIAVCNQKGGCGKTTSVINLAAGIAALGKRVLVIDLDSQCNATSGLGINLEADDLSSFDLLVDPTRIKLTDVVMPTEYDNLFVVPGSIELSEFESRVASEIGRENKLKKALARTENEYDFILLDTPPSLGLISVNALNAATEVHIAMQAHPFALDGLNLLLETIRLVQEELNPTLQISGVYITMYDGRTNISKEIKSKVESMRGMKNKIFKTVIRQNVKVTEATQARVPVMYFDLMCTGTQDYNDLSAEVVKQKVSPANSRNSHRHQPEA